MTTSRSHSASAQEVLSAPMPLPNDAGSRTIGEFLVQLLTALWDQGPDFSGKRPFGNSGWTYSLYGALVDANLIDGERDEDGDLTEADTDKGFSLIYRAIQALHPDSPNKEAP